MPDPPVPASRRVRPSRVRNIDTDRLRRRYTFLVQNRAAIARATDGRKGLQEYARELLTIESELARRSETIQRVRNQER